MLASLLSLALGAGFVEVSAQVGLGPDVIAPAPIPRLCFADLNGDGWPDLVLDRSRVFLSADEPSSPIGRRFAEVPPAKTGLQTALAGTTTVFADLDNDGKLDAITAENVQPDDPKLKDHGRRTRWQKGNGDGTFATAKPLPTPPRPTIAVSAGDLNKDGWLDLYFANSYKAGDTFEGFPGDLLLSDGKGSWDHVSLPDEKIPFDDTTDPGGRPSYGCMILSLDGRTPAILSLSYGRRWNRLWVRQKDGWVDQAPKLGLDGDGNRSGVYPDWLVEYAKTHPQFPNAPEKPFRSNGNNFDASIGDVDNDGRFDLFLADITHAWAGDSSDRSRLLFQGADGSFHPRPGYAVDRIPDPKDQHWNQGDLFAELADLDCDGLLDLILSSGDYPDQHLRIYLQQNGRFQEATDALGVLHDGSQQISLADIDRDGALDFIVGQTFFRLNDQQIGGRKPRLRLFVNRLYGGNRSLELRLSGDGKSVNRNALGTVVRAELADGRKLQRQLIGIGGHAGKQHDFLVHFGLGTAMSVKRLEVVWPSRTQVFRDVAAGQYTLAYGKSLSRR